MRIGVKLHETFQLMRKEKTAYFFLAPYYILFFIFTICPVLISIGLSFTYYNILQQPKLIGWSNYVNLILADDVFIVALKNTLLYAMIVGPASYAISFFVAWLINEMSPKLRAILVVLFYAPTISGNIYLVWKIAFSSDSYGYVNGSLLKSGFIDTPILWLQDPRFILVIIIIVGLWLSLGTNFLVFVAGFQGLDRSLFEAAAVDGVKNRWQELWYITLPSLRPQLMFSAVISITACFAVSDVSVNMAGFPSVQYAGETLVTHLMDYGNIRFEMGYASAIAVVIFVIMIGVNQFVHRLLLKVGT